MAITLADIRARLQAQENKSTATKSTMDNGIYAHWTVADGETSVVRFLPDADPKNPFFWVERQVIKLPFSGIKGQPDSKPLTVQVPCIEMWEKNACPILGEVRPWFKDESLKELGGKYWKKRSFIFQGFVRQSPLKEDSLPENPIRRFVMARTIYNIIKSALLDPELEEVPTDYINGLDFKINKVKDGTYSSYGTSAWMRKESALAQAELEAIEKFGLFNLSDFLPKRPTEADLKVQLEMFHASVEGETYDLDRWGSYYKPYGLYVPNAETALADPAETVNTDVAEEPAPKAVVKKAKESKDDDADEAPAAGGDRAQQILAAIRNRNKK